MAQDDEPSILGRLRITGEEKELLYRFLRDEIGREGIRGLAIIGLMRERQRLRLQIFFLYQIDLSHNANPLSV